MIRRPPRSPLFPYPTLSRSYVDGQQLETQYRSMQQLTANVPANIIASPGQRLIKVQTPDGKLYSNEQQLNVMQPPQPTYTYRSEEHTSELQSRSDIVCRLLL